MLSGFKVYVVCWKLCMLKSHSRFTEKKEKKRKGIADLLVGFGY